MPNIQYQYRVPATNQPTQDGWLTSSAVRTWWLWFSWWVIPLGMFLLFFPYLQAWGVFDRNPSPVSSHGNVWTPVQPPPAPAARQAPPPAPAPSRELTPEEKADKFWESVLRREP